jgi:hypothetical protein
MLVALARAFADLWKKLNALSPTPAPVPAPKPAPMPATVSKSAVASASAANPLEGKPLRYLIGKDGWSNGADGEVTEVGYDVTIRAPLGIGVKYVNLTAAQSPSPLPLSRSRIYPTSATLKCRVRVNPSSGVKNGERERSGGAGADLASRILAAMKARNYPIAVGPDVLNIVYIEGADTPDGKPNANRPNAFDSLRILLRVLPPDQVRGDGSAKILGMWEAITHAGLYWETHRMNPAGAFHIALGQQTCWQLGRYHGMEALIQSAPIIGTRDDKNNFKREGPTVRGDFGVHHHWGYNYPKDDAGRSSAGCQVGRTEAGHNQFIALLKTDARYKTNHQFIWSSTVLPVEWLA